jgi:hypothetical protein
MPICEATATDAADLRSFIAHSEKVGGVFDGCRRLEEPGCFQSKDYRARRGPGHFEGDAKDSAGRLFLRNRRPTRRKWVGYLEGLVEEFSYFKSQGSGILKEMPRIRRIAFSLATGGRHRRGTGCLYARPRLLTPQVLFSCFIAYTVKVGGVS